MAVLGIFCSLEKSSATISKLQEQLKKEKGQCITNYNDNLGPLHMSPVGGTNFVFCSYGKFNPGYRPR